MRLVIFRSLVVLTVGAAVLIGVLYIASTVDARSPEVLSFDLTQPLPDDPETALITSSLEVAFNEPVQVDEGTSPVTFDPAVDGSVSWSGSTMIFTPRDPLELETMYVVTVGTGIRDGAGNRIGTPPPSFTFETAGRPTVIASQPEDGADEVSVEEPMLITFSTLMDTGSVEQALSVQPGFEFELRWSGPVLEVAPLEPLDPGREYVLRIETDAADIAGVALADAAEIRFRTVPAGLEPIAVAPADGVDGIAPSAPIAVIFDRAIDPDSVTPDVLTLEPELAGTLEVVSPAGETVDDDQDGAASGTVLRFAPSGPLPLNTTFEVTVAAEVRALDGSQLAETLTWTFTTGAPAGTLSNQITFISDQGGVANVWAMNADGSGEHQVSTELAPVLDYAIAPDGGQLVIADGRRLIAVRADGSDRRVLTDDRHVEFDPTFAPDGQRVAFARVDADTGDGLGLWLMAADGGDATAVVLPAEVGPGSTPAATDGDEPGPGLLRAPRFSPDGHALAFVDPDGWVGVLELPSERLTRVAAVAAAPPAWLPDSSAILVTHRGRGADGDPLPPGAPVPPMVARPANDLTVSLMNRSGVELRDTGIAAAAAVVAIDRDGAIAYVDADGRLHITDDGDEPGQPVAGVAGDVVLEGAFAPGEDAMVLVIADRGDAAAQRGAVEHLELPDGERSVLTPSGAIPRWLP